MPVGSSREDKAKEKSEQSDSRSAGEASSERGSDGGRSGTEDHSHREPSNKIDDRTRGLTHGISKSIRLVVSLFCVFGMASAIILSLQWFSRNDYSAVHVLQIFGVFIVDLVVIGIGVSIILALEKAAE